MAKSFSKLRDSLSIEAKESSNRQFQNMLRGYPLASIREGLGLSQGEIASRLKVSQAAISKLETRDDFLLSTLHRYLTAVGGTVHMYVRYGSVRSEILPKSNSKGFCISPTVAIERPASIDIGRWSNVAVRPIVPNSVVEVDVSSIGAGHREAAGCR